MSSLVLYLLDLVAITFMVFALYFRRHRRRDMMVAYLVANLGVLAVANALASSTVAAGLGLGLFGILSIIRLRSAELDQAEIAYYFAALALGLLAGISVTPDWLSPVLMVSIVAAVYVGDHPHLFSGYRIQRVELDAVYTDEERLIEVLEEMFGATVHRLKVRNVDMVRDITTVEVRYQLPSTASRSSESARAEKTNP